MDISSWLRQGGGSGKGKKAPPSFGSGANLLSPLCHPKIVDEPSSSPTITNVIVQEHESTCIFEGKQ